MSKNEAVLSFTVIAAAVNGNVDAINAVLKRYEGYIAQLSTRTLYDEDGCGCGRGNAPQTGNEVDYKNP